jgi:hypothetical protein
MLLAACAQQETAAVIGVRPHAEVIATPIAFDPTTIQAGLTAQLADSKDFTAIQEGTLAPGQLPIDTFLSVRQQERWAYWQSFGLTECDKRLVALAFVRSQVASDGLIGSYQKGAIIGLLDNAIAQVSQLRTKIAYDQLVDQTKKDVASVFSLRVGRLVLPRAKEMLSAYDLGALAVIYADAMVNWPAEILNAQSLGCDVSTAQYYVTALSAQIGALRYYSSAMLGDVQANLLASAHNPQRAGKNAASNAQFDAGAGRAAIQALKNAGC